MSEEHDWRGIVNAPSIDPVEIVAANLEERWVQLSTGERLPITQMLTDDRRFTNIPDEAAWAVAGSDAVGWVAFSINHEGE